MNDNLLTVYALRHLPSEQNVAGRGPSDTPLAEEEAKDLVGLFAEFIDVVKPNFLISGTLQRHKQTADLVLRRTKVKPEVHFSDKINAFASGKIVERPGEATEEMYGLDEFSPNGNGLYVGEGLDGEIIKFDPKELGILPFDPLYNAGYIHRGIQDLVIPDSELDSFDRIEERVDQYQRGLLKIQWLHGHPLTVVTIGSCSLNAFNLEYGLHMTVGENTLQEDEEGVLRHATHGSEDRRIFPQQHDQVMVFEYTKKHREKDATYLGRIMRPDEDTSGTHTTRLRPVDGNIKIETLIDRLQYEQ